MEGAKEPITTHFMILLVMGIIEKKKIQIIEWLVVEIKIMEWCSFQK